MKNNEKKPKAMVLKTDTGTVRMPVGEGNLFTFPDGVPAFEEYKTFVLLSDEEVQPFFYMKSMGVTPEVSFVCVDPFLICPDYRVRVGKMDVTELGLERGEDVLIFAFVTVRDDPADITANLQGPVIVNLKNKLGRQIISEGTEYDVRFRLWDTLKSLETSSQDEPKPAPADGTVEMAYVRHA